MRLLLFIADRSWSGCARTFITAARGLSDRGHDVTLVSCADSAVERRAREAGLDPVAIPADANIASDTWWLRRLLQERSIEVAFVHGERDQLIVSSAMRMAERGAVIRRVPASAPFIVGRTGRMAMRMAATGAMFTTEHDASSSDFPIPNSTAPLGVDAAVLDAVQPAPRAALGAPAAGLLIVCRYEPESRLRLATVLRTFALLAPRHRKIHLAVLGPGSTDADLQMHAAALGINQLVSFLGEPEDAHTLMRSADVGWVVAEQDTAAYASLDFMAMRIPILAERDDLQQHYVADGITGLLLASGDPSDTASTVASFLGREDSRAAMGNAGHARVQREFPESAMIDGFEQTAMLAGDRTRWVAR